MHQYATWYGGRPQPGRLCVRWGLGPLKFSAHVYCGQMAGWIQMILVMVVGLSPVDFVLDRDPPPPKFSAHVYCGQMAEWIEMVLGMVVGLSSVYFVLDRDPP